jgi:hypothetical protein
MSRSRRERPLFYAQYGELVVPEPDLEIWGWWFETSAEQRQVAVTVLPGNVQVSTVFLGVDHQFSLNPDAPPLLYETLVFGGVLADTMDRYSSREAALAGHARILAAVVAAEAATQQLLSECAE